MRYLVAGLSIALCGLLVYASEFPWLAELDANEGVRSSGERLVGLDYGLHALETSPDNPTRVLIGVHGWRSQGYEWVYPLQTLDDDETLTFFFRWDYSQCPIDGGRLLLASVGELLGASTGLESITVVGHSLGGVLVTAIGDLWQFDVATELHVIAAPLASLESPRCDQQLPTRLTPKVRLFQWRTQHRLDGAFREQAVDPQNVEIRDSIVIRLPTEYRGRRLGHNWSISWVADELATD